MQTVEELFDIVRKNEEIARKLFDIEVQILNINRFRDYFQLLLTSVQDKFQVDFVWISLTDIPANLRMIESLGDNLHQPVLLPSLDFHALTHSSREPILVNQSLSRFWKMMPAPIRREVASLAVLPLVLDGKLIGSLNFGSVSADRYDPDKDSFFLRQLAVKASICLSSVAAHEQVFFLATRDPLTLLRNRREMEETLEQELSRSKRHQQPTAGVFIDCDDFKQVNDGHGHDCGDAYLKHVAELLNQMIRRSDTAFRFAGDEFVLLLPNQTSAGAEVIAARIREEAVQRPLHYQGAKVEVRFSYGVASTEDLTDPCVRQLLKRADQNLYQMKAVKTPAQTLAVAAQD